jgi:hypothetical protein
MIKKILHKSNLQGPLSARRDLEHWLSRPDEERIAAVGNLRKQYHGNTERLQSVARVFQQTQS